MQPGTAIITARSRQEAMDWALVLASQGIEAVIEAGPDSKDWLLLVPEIQYFPARHAIRQYIIENRNRRWQKEWEATGLLFDGRAIFWFLALTLLHGVVEAGVEGLRGAGMMNAAAVHKGEWWRLITATTLHADLAHLIGNTSSGIVLVGFAMGLYRAGAGLLGALLAGVIGNLIGLLFHGAQYQSLGASGMVMGALGLLAAYSLRHWREASGLKMAGRGLMAAVLVLLLLGSDPRSDVIVHAGGFLGGCALGTLWLGLPERWRARPAVESFCLGLCSALVLAAWALAMM